MEIFVLLSLEAFKQQKFDQVAAKIMDAPDSYLAFDSVSIFIKPHGWMNFHKAPHGQPRAWMMVLNTFLP